MKSIYMFPSKIVLSLFPEYNEFTCSDWNELEELPEKVYELIDFAKENDLVYNPYNFMLCFNLQDEETYHGDWIMFIPDEKFNVN